MNLQTKQLLIYAPGSVGDTSRAYALSYSRIIRQKTKDLEEFNNALNQVISIRELAYKKIGVNDQNLLIPASTNGVNAIYRILDPIDEEAKSNSDISEEDYSLLISFLRLDLPTMVLYAMLLESNIKRQGFAAADSEFLEEALRTLYSETYKICPYQTMFSEDDFLIANTDKVKLFLSKADNSLDIMIRVSLSHY